MMAVRSVDPADRAPRARSKLWCFAWQKRIGMGAIAASREPCPIWGTRSLAARSPTSSNEMASNQRRSTTGRRLGKRYLRCSVKREEADFSQPRRNDSRHWHRLGEARPRKIPFGPAEQVDLFPVRL